jgi:hypothetical protein
VKGEGTAALGATAAPAACELENNENKDDQGDKINIADCTPEYQPPSCSAKTLPGFRTAKAGGTMLPLITLACNWQPLPHVTVTRPFNSPFCHSPTRRNDAGGGGPVTVNTPLPCRKPL